MMPWPKAPEAAEPAPESAAPKPKAARSFRVDPLAIAASAAAIGFVAVSLFAVYDHVRQHDLVAGKALEAQELSRSVAALKTRIDTIEAARSQEQTAELKKTLGEIRSAAAVAQGANASLAQLGQRVDKIDKEQNGRLDKLNERIDQATAKIDQATSNRSAEIVARLERLEKRPVTVAVAQPAPPAPPAPSPKLTTTTAPQSPAPGVSNDVTGSIDKPKPLLRGYTLAEVTAASLISKVGTAATASPLATCCRARAAFCASSGAVRTGWS